MSIISWVMAIFAVLGALDRIIGNKLGIGKEFERGIGLIAPMVLSMAGMLILAPAIGELLRPVSAQMTGVLDPSFLAGILLANDMGGAPLAEAMANNALVGKFNGYVVASMMGATISFTLPYCLGIVKVHKQKQMFLGFLCGIVTIPVGSMVGGLVLGIDLVTVLINLLPMIIVSGVIVFGLIKFPNTSVRIFAVLGAIIKILVTIGLVVGIFEALTQVKLIPYTDDIHGAMKVIVNATCVMAGAFPLIGIISRVLAKPLKALGAKLGISDVSALGFVSTLATNATTLEMMNDMDDKGAVLNASFAVSAAFTFAGHLAYTLAGAPECLPAVILGKLVAGVLAVLVAVFVNKRNAVAVGGIGD